MTPRILPTITPCHLSTYLALLATGLSPVVASRLVGIDHRLLA